MSASGQQAGEAAVREAQPLASGRRVARNSVLQAGADAIGKLGSIVLYAVMAREAGVTAFGDFTTAASLSVLVMVAAFGMDYRVTRLVARGEEGVGGAFWGAIVLKLGLGSVLLATLVGVAALGPYDDRVVVATLLLGLAILVELTMLSPHALFRGREELRPVAIALIVYRGLLAAAGIALLLAGASIVAVAAGWLAAAVLGLAYSVAKLRALRLDLPFEVTRESLRVVGLDSIGLGLAGALGATLARLDIVLLGILKDSDTVALYGAAYRLMESTQFLTAALALSSFPMLARLTRETSPTLADATGIVTKTVLVVTAPVAIVFLLAGETLLEAVYGPEFGDATATLRILGAVVVLSGVFSLITFVLTAQRRQRPIVIALVAGTVVNVAANLVLIPMEGAEGAALAWALTMIVLSALLVVPSLRVTGRIAVRRTFAGPLVASAAMGGAGLAAGGGGLGVLAGLVVFPVVLVLVEKRLHPDDLERVVRALRGSAAPGRTPR